MNTAREFALRAHGQQQYGDKPYAAHLDEVVQILIEYGFDDMIDAGYLHDVVEDTHVSIGVVSALFGSNTARLVAAVSGVGANREEKQRWIMDMLALFPSACPLKLADRIANLEASTAEKNTRTYRMYMLEQPEFARVVRPNVPPAMWNRLMSAFEKGN